MNFVIIDVSVLEGALGKIASCVRCLLDIADDDTYKIGEERKDWYKSWTNVLNVSPLESGQTKRLKQIFRELTVNSLKKKFVFVGYQTFLHDDELRNGYCAVISDVEKTVIRSFFHIPEMALTKNVPSTIDRSVIFHKYGDAQSNDKKSWQACVIFRDNAPFVPHAELQKIQWEEI